MWQLCPRGKNEPINTDVCNVKVPQTRKCREQEEHLIWRESLLDKAQSVCVCGGSRAAAVQAQLRCWQWGSCQPWKKPVELFQQLFTALVPLHTRQSAKPELNGISGGICNRQNCAGLFFFFFLTKEFLLLEARFGDDFLLVMWWILIVLLVFSESSFSTSYSPDIWGMEKWKARLRNVKL